MSATLLQFYGTPVSEGALAVFNATFYPPENLCAFAPLR
jgi:hypothetical protein